MMSPHHPMMQGGPPTSLGGPGGGPLASLANFHPPGHPGVPTSMGSPNPGGPHHQQRPPMFPQMGEARMGARLRMMTQPEGGPPGPHMMGPQFRHMMMRGMAPGASQPQQQMSPLRSPQMSPQMSPVMPGQPLRHLDAMPDDKSFMGGYEPFREMALKMKGSPGSGGPPPGHPPLSQSPMAVVKMEPGDAGSPSLSQEQLDMDQKATHNELLKQLLGGAGGRTLTTPDSEDSLPALTPDQQRQLEMIDSMPLCKEKELTPEEWDSNTPEEKERILDMRRQEFELKRQHNEQTRKIKRKALTGEGGPTAGPKKKRKPKAGVVSGGVPAANVGAHGMALPGGDLGLAKFPGPGAPQAGAPKKRHKKARPGAPVAVEGEMSSHTASLLSQLHSMPPTPLQEPIIALAACIMPVKGAPKVTGKSALKGRFSSAYLDGIQDLYGSLLFPQPPPGLRPSSPSADTLAQRKMAAQAKLRIMQGMEPLHEGADLGGAPQRGGSPRLSLPPGPRIEIKPEALAVHAGREESPDTVVSSSSPEVGFNDLDPDYPSLRPIQPAADYLSLSPIMPLVHPLPVKASYMAPEARRLIKPEPIKQQEPGADGRDMTVNLPNLTSGLAQPFLDPALDQQVSVTLTLSTGAAQDIGAVISAIADLLKIAVPPTYEVTRSPSPERFVMSMTHKEEAVNIHTLMSTRPRFCQHCDVFVLASGIAKLKREFTFLLDQDPECGDEEMIFCSMNCSIQFSADLDARQRQVIQRRMLMEEEEEEEQQRIASATPPQPLPESISGPPSDDKVSANMDAIIAAVATDASRSPYHLQTSPNMSGLDSPLTSPASPQIGGEDQRVAAKRVSSPGPGSQLSSAGSPLAKKWIGQRWMRGNHALVAGITRVARPAPDMDQLWKAVVMCCKPLDAGCQDTRVCALCQGRGDGASDGPSRLLNMDINQWVHLNCALWSYDVYETCNGALMNVEEALARSRSKECVCCQKTGATLACFKARCAAAYHLSCAVSRGCMFYQDKTFLCSTHIPKVALGTELTTLTVLRRVYVNRCEERQVATLMQQMDDSPSKCELRVGSLLLHHVGQLLPHQILSGRFNSKEYIYPVGYKASRLYWSCHSVYQRCRYVCSIHDLDGCPEFRIQVQSSSHEAVTFKDSSPQAAWQHILKPLERMRVNADLVKMFHGELSSGGSSRSDTAHQLFGLREPDVQRILESLPGTDLLGNYNFKFGRSALIEMPPAINPSGCARSEPKLRTHFRRPPQRALLQSKNTTNQTQNQNNSSGGGYTNINIYDKQFVKSKSEQYRRLKENWKTLCVLGRSRIQGLGLYAEHDLDKYTMVIEYIGELIRNETANRREKEYEDANRGVYMFRIANDQVVDATMTGGPARYINHSCSPNCKAEVVDIGETSKIIIITTRKIPKGEELTYDYKFDFEDDQHKIPCMCGAPNCRKWMN